MLFNLITHMSKPKSAKIKWSKTPPTKDGHYWFYGWPYGADNRPASWHLIETMVTPTGILYAIAGGFWDPTHQGAYGLFTPVTYPPTPELVHPKP
jgi:hypothetical protein